MAQRVEIGARSFSSKKAAAEAIKKILYGSTLGGVVADAIDHEFLLGLLRLHRHAAQKIGPGVAHFEIRQEAGYGTLCFHVVRTDGSVTDFSYLSCLSPPSAEKEALAGLRSAVRDQITEFRERAFGSDFEIICPVTGEVLLRNACHVDHHPSFEDLVAKFLGLIEWGLADVQVHPTKDGETVTELANPDLKRAWQDFHREHAGLRVVSRRANLSILRKRSP